MAAGIQRISARGEAAAAGGLVNAKDELISPDEILNLYDD